MPWRDRLLIPRTEYDEPVMPPSVRDALGKKLNACLEEPAPNSRIEAVLRGLPALFDEPQPAPEPAPCSPPQT